MIRFRNYGAQAEAPQCEEGDLYKILHVAGTAFPLYYGYYDTCDRENPMIDPMPIYPDFLETPRFTADGQPFITKMQDACRHYVGQVSDNKECAECIWYRHGEELMGTCACPENQKEN